MKVDFSALQNTGTIAIAEIRAEAKEILGMERAIVWVHDPTPLAFAREGVVPSSICDLEHDARRTFTSDLVAYAIYDGEDTGWGRKERRLRRVWWGCHADRQVTRLREWPSCAVAISTIHAGVESWWPWAYERLYHQERGSEVLRWQPPALAQAEDLGTVFRSRRKRNA